LLRSCWGRPGRAGAMPIGTPEDVRRRDHQYGVCAAPNVAADGRRCLEIKQAAGALDEVCGPENAAARNGRTEVRQLVACQTCRNFAMSMPRRSLADALYFGLNRNACSCD
jgi:hypothetical protein